MEKIKVFIEITSKDNIPYSGSDGSAGLDLIAAENCVILPGETKLIGTGIKTVIPKGYEIQVRPRSGLSFKTLMRIPNSPGTIDSDYRDEIKIICENTFQFSDMTNKLLTNPNTILELKNYQPIAAWQYFKQRLNADEKLLDIDPAIVNSLQQEVVYLDHEGYPFGAIKIKQGERIAQMVIAKYYSPEFEIVDDVQKIGENRGGGFGSTGIDS